MQALAVVQYDRKFSQDKAPALTFTLLDADTLYCFHSVFTTWAKLPEAVLLMALALDCCRTD